MLGGSESGGVIDHSDELTSAETKNESFTRSWDGRAETQNVDARITKQDPIVTFFNM